MFEEYQELVNLSRLALTGRKEDVQLFVRRLSRRLRKSRPTVADQLDSVLSAEASQAPAMRGAATPVDLDSRLELVRPEFPVELPVAPVWSESVERSLNQIVSERARLNSLVAAGLNPTRSALLTGPPGVGKSLAARWLASTLDRPLQTLDLAAVMSSYLGRTGANVKLVLDYAKQSKCVLLLDEFDAVAKRRDDREEIGELKRLVTVLLQEIDEWPASGLLIAATNHPDLLDPAIWRRFDMVIEFPMPGRKQSLMAIERFLGDGHSIDRRTMEIVASVLRGASFSNIERELLRARREAIIFGQSLAETLKSVIRDSVTSLPIGERKRVALRLSKLGLSQHDVNGWTGVHRATIRAALKDKEI